MNKLKKDDQMKTAGEVIGSVPETSLDWDPSGNDNQENIH